MRYTSKKGLHSAMLYKPQYLGNAGFQLPSYLPLLVEVQHVIATLPTRNYMRSHGALRPLFLRW
jgi:hypothetical protein